MGLSCGVGYLCFTRKIQYENTYLCKYAIYKYNVQMWYKVEYKDPKKIKKQENTKHEVFMLGKKSSFLERSLASLCVSLTKWCISCYCGRNEKSCNAWLWSKYSFSLNGSNLKYHVLKILTFLNFLNPIVGQTSNFLLCKYLI